MNYSARIGFMQGRLSPPLLGRIQCFPVEHWRAELEIGRESGFPFLEWTLDNDTFDQNPLVTAVGREEIRQACARTGMRILSLTGDSFMEAPFYKLEGAARVKQLDVFKSVLSACDELAIRFCVVPLVDNGRIENSLQQEILRTELERATSDVKIVFESDFAPSALKEFISRFSSARFGINYDIGNSASLGYDPEVEIVALGDRIWNVHVKDRLRGGTTVPLGTGAAQFATVFRALRRTNYAGNFILQTARASDGDHLSAIQRYRDQLIHWLAEAEESHGT